MIINSYQCSVVSGYKQANHSNDFNNWLHACMPYLSVSFGVYRTYTKSAEPQYSDSKTYKVIIIIATYTISIV